MVQSDTVIPSIALHQRNGSSIGFKIRAVFIVFAVLLTLQCKPLFLSEPQEPVPVSMVPLQPRLSHVAVVQSAVVERRYILEEGDNLGKLLLRELDSTVPVATLVSLAGEEIDLRRMRPGQEVITLWQDDHLVEMQLPIQNDILRIFMIEGNWQVYRFQREVQRLVRVAQATIDSSLFNAAVDNDIPLDILMEMIQLFSFEVDFQRDIYQNDYFQVAYEEFYDELGNKLYNGRVVFAFLESNGRTRRHELFRYVDQQGQGDYFDTQGNTIRRELLKTPVNGAYISSGYGMRVSPFLGYSLMHKGMDFAAPQGTPIYAAGSGTITQAGWSDVYGWYIKIRHVNHYETLYAHMVNFANGMRRGARVEQGEVIGYVGNTGMSTGPHCHYEVLYYGSHINPATVEFPPGRVLSGLELELFQKRRENYISAFL